MEDSATPVTFARFLIEAAAQTVFELFPTSEDDDAELCAVETRPFEHHESQQTKNLRLFTHFSLLQPTHCCIMNSLCGEKELLVMGLPKCGACDKAVGVESHK